MTRILFMVGLVLVLVVGASVGYFNAQQVRFNYLFGQLEAPLIALLVADFALAVVLTLAVIFIRMFTLRAELRRLKRQLRDTESELKNLRNLPLPQEQR